ncbi:MAG: UDP-3-O-acyl-N-acetylglucosamine deacetylase [Hyphomicrobium sp.]
MSKRFIGALQTTISSEIQISGNGVHKGTPVNIILHPASENTGLQFAVTDGNKIVAELPAHYSHVSNLTLCTVLGNSEGVTVSTVEHLLAALRGLSVDNCIIEIDGKEVPIMDGSSAAFVDAIDDVGVSELSAPRNYIQVLKPIRVVEGDCWGEIAPYHGFHLDLEIDFSSSLIGNQHLALDISPSVFRKELSRARTFGFMSDVERLWKAGLALGANLTNTVAIGDGRIMNTEGLRDPLEFVRHKMLDAVGDLSLSGLPLMCSYKSVRGGHRLNSLILQSLFADQTAWTIVQTPLVKETNSRLFSSLETAFLSRIPELNVA